MPCPTFEFDDRADYLSVSPPYCDSVSLDILTTTSTITSSMGRSKEGEEDLSGGHLVPAEDEEEEEEDGDGEKNPTSSSCAGPEWLGRQLQNGGGVDILLLDCRASPDFNKSHVAGSIHVAIPSLMLRRLKKGNLPLDTVIKGHECKQRFHSKWKTDTVVLYDECTVDLGSNPNGVVSLLYRKLTEDGCRVRFLKGGFAVFHATFSEHCVEMTDNDETSIFGLRNLQINDEDHLTTEDNALTPNSSSTFPVEVLPCLFLGNAKNAGDLQCLSKNGITYILNVTPNVPNTFETDCAFKYMQIPITDHWSQNLASFFPEAIAFIDEARQRKQGVLVHCLAGISRSVTVTVAYLMHTLALSLNDAYDYVKRCKPNISPNFNFMGQLLDFERTLTLCKDCSCGSNSTSTTSSSSSSGGKKEGRGGEMLLCTCTRDAKTYFSSPTSTSSSGLSSTSSTSSSSSMVMSSPSSTAFDYDIPPTPS